MSELTNRTLYIRRYFGFLWRALLLDGSTVLATRHALSEGAATRRGIDANLAHGGQTIRINRKEAS